MKTLDPVGNMQGYDIDGRLIYFGVDGFEYLPNIMSNRTTKISNSYGMQTLDPVGNMQGYDVDGRLIFFGVDGFE